MFGALLDPVLSLIAEGRTYVLLAPVYLLLLGGERLAYALRRREWNDRDGAANLAITVTILGLHVLVAGFVPVGVILLLSEHASLWTLPTTGAGWLAAFLLHDLAWYVDHRIAHRSGFFWAMHHVHHSSPEYNTTVASRGFLLDDFLSRPVFYLLPIFGVTAYHYIVVRVFVSVFGIIQHTRLIGRVPLLDAVLATPSNHRVHHGSDDIYIDRNYGEVLILWDRLFGSYQRELHEPRYGVTDADVGYNPVRIELAGFAWLRARMASAPRLSDKLRYLVMPPEWRHDATDLAGAAALSLPVAASAPELGARQ